MVYYNMVYIYIYTHSINVDIRISHSGPKDQHNGGYQKPWFVGSSCSWSFGPPTLRGLPYSGVEDGLQIPDLSCSVPYCFLFLASGLTLDYH